MDCSDFNLMPTESNEAMLAGANAFHEGLPRDSNPYDFDMYEYTDWHRGWDEAEGYDKYLKDEIEI